MSADQLERLRAEQLDLITVAQARRFLSTSAIRHRLASGRWQRPHRGVLLATSALLSNEQRRWLAVLAAGPGALLAGPSATAEYRLHPPPSTIHLLLPAGRRCLRPPAGVIVHRTNDLSPDDIDPRGRPPRTRPARSIADAASWAVSDDAARFVIAAGFQRQLITFDQLMEVLDRFPRVHRHALIVQTAADASGGSHSLAELDYLRHNRAAGLPEPERQVVRRDARGRRRYLDVRYDPWGIHVEIDGAQHADPLASWADMRRQNDIWIAGDRVLRFPAWLVRERPSEVFDQVRTALIASGWRPGQV